MMFQTFLRYDPLCKTKPKAKIFNEASTQNIPKKYASVFSCNKTNKNVINVFLMFYLYSYKWSKQKTHFILIYTLKNVKEIVNSKTI